MKIAQIPINLKGEKSFDSFQRYWSIPIMIANLIGI